MTVRSGARALVVLTALALASAPAADAKKKHKRARCKGTQVTVTIQGRRSCRSLKQAVPKPSAGDVRAAFVGDALAVRLKGVHDRRGRTAVAPWERKGAA